MEIFKRYHANRPIEERNPMEMRSSPRVAASVPAEIRLAGQAGTIRCQLRDVGTGGVCVQTDSPISYKALSSVTIHLPGSPLTVDVEGTWQREATLERAILTGARFLNIGRDDAQRIRKFVEQSAGELIEFLQNRSQLRNLELDEALDLALSSRLREASAGTWICTEGSTRPGEDSLFIVMKGVVALAATVAREGDTEIERVGVGGAFGGVPLISDEGPPFSSIAVSDATLLELDRNAFSFLERAKPYAARRLGRAIVGRQVGHLRALVSRLERRGVR
jgi:CRP-like cAMP-binding protein